MGRKLRVLWGGEGKVGPPPNTMWPGPKPTTLPSGTLIHPAVWPHQTWAADYLDAGKAFTRKFRMWGLLCHFPWGGGTGAPPNIVWPEPRPTCMPSFILIRPTVWPQYTNVTDRTGKDRQDNGPMA